MKTLFSRAIIGRAATLSALFISAASIAFALSVFDIEFPIPELGNCADKTECKAYCDDSANADACQAFARKYGLGGGVEPEGDNRLRQIEEDGGPGGCATDEGDPFGSCEEFCGKQENMRVCVAYAKEHGLMDARELAEAEKVIKALDGGAKLPAACKDERSCKATCEEPKDVETARSCFEFAEKAGLLPPGVTKEKAERVFRIIEEGKTPFKSFKDFDQCEDPQSDEILEQCIAIAIENDLLPPEEAEMIKKTGGKGPGGCRGREQCETYCEEHQDECFKFGEEHGLIKEEDRERMREGMERFREGVQNAPPAVLECLKTTVGADTLEGLMSGSKRPSPRIGEQMRTCFETFFMEQGGHEFEGGEGMEGMMGGEFPHEEGFQGGEEGSDGAVMGRMPPRGGQGRGGVPQMLMAECLKQVRGEVSADGSPSDLRGQMDDKVRACIESAMRKNIEARSAGPGGCRTKEECTAYCSDPAHEEACGKLGGERGGEQGMMQPPGQGGEGEFHGEFPPQGPRPEGGGEEYQKQYNAEHQQEYNRQYQEQYQKQYQGQYQQQQQQGQYPNQPPPGTGEYHPPEGGTYPSGQYPTQSPPPTDDYHPPEGSTYPSGTQSPPPTVTTESAPPPSEPAPAPAPAPTSRAPRQPNDFFAAVIQFLFGR